MENTDIEGRIANQLIEYGKCQIEKTSSYHSMKCECSSQPLQLHTILYMNGECNVTMSYYSNWPFFPLFYSFFQFCDSAEVSGNHP
jgi:hypothetical protein